MTEPQDRPKKRGRETAYDMVLSLAVVMVLVLVVFFLAQPPDSDKAEIRVIDPVSDLRAFGRAVPGAPVPGFLPEGYRPTVASYQSSPDRVRVGWVTPRTQYLEFQASAATGDEREEFLVEATGRGEAAAPVLIDGLTWQQYVDEDGSISLVRTEKDVLVVLGGVRASASMDEIRVLAGAIARTP